MEILKIYQYALQREYEGKNFFEQNASRLNHAAAVEVFKRLAEEEQRHINFIQAQIDALQDRQLPEPPGKIEIPEAGFFSQRAQSELIDQTVAEAMVPDLPVLRMAYLIERDFAEFYEMAASTSSGNAKYVLDQLAGWERVHERLFKQMHDSAFEQYAQMPWGG
jgi:rubrerythrin